MKNILRNAKKRLAVAAIGIGSAFSAGCDIEDIFYAMNSMGEGDKEALVGKFYGAGPFWVDTNPRLVRGGIRVTGDSGLNLRVGRDNPPNNRFHINVQPYFGGETVRVGNSTLEAHIYPQDYIRGAGRIVSTTVRYYPLAVTPLPHFITYPLYQQQEAGRGHF